MGYLKDYCMLQPLSEELTDSLVNFSCAHEKKIESFFRNEALAYSKEMMGKTYCFVHKDTKQIVCAFCVACASVSTDEMPKVMRNKVNRKVPYVKQRETYPAILLAQLAVNDDFAHFHIGDELMQLIKVWIILHGSQIAARFLVVDAINDEHVLQYYVRNKFHLVFATEEEEKLFCEMPTEERLDTRFMLVDLKEVRNNL